MKETVLEVVNLSKSFRKHIAVDNISFKVFDGDIFGFLGPNGSGKTTTIRMILNLIKPSSGHISVCNHDPQKNFINSAYHIGAIIETPKFHPYLTGDENLTLMANLSSLPKQNVLDVLKMVGLFSNKDRNFSEYSLGMKQRLGIANALLNSPKLVILDEPTNGLDPKGMKEIRDLIVKLSQEKGITFIISTHLLYEVEQICNRVAILNNGKLIKEGEVSSLIGTESEEVILNTPKIKESINILSTLSYVNSYKLINNEVHISLLKGTTSQLISTLVKSSIDVNYLTPVKASLEDIFLDLTKGDDEND